MFRKMTYSFLAIVFWLGLSAHAQTIVWISETNANADGAYYDQGWIDLLEDAGYTVDFRPGEWMTLDADKIATLESADLIIGSRNSNSGNYASDAAEVTQWNSTATPLIMMTVYWCRNNRWLWINDTNINEYSPEAMMQVVDGTHPVFDNVQTTGGLVDVIDETVDSGQNSFILTSNVGNGTLIAQREDNQAVWIAEWETGVEFYEGSGQIAGDKRMLFLAGGGGAQTAGSFNLNDIGAKIFLNAVKYMIGTRPVKAYIPNPADGTIHTDTWINLSWTPGDLAVSHDVYLGDSLNEVEAAARDSELFRGNQAATFYVAGFPGFAYPEGLVPGTTYYWRIDEVNDADPNSPWKGDVWSFSIPPRTAYNPDPADGAEFVDTGATLSWTAGFGAKLHTVYVGTDFDDVNNAAGGAPQSGTTYKPASLEPEKVCYWRVDESDPPAVYKGDVWGFTTLGAAGNPQPANGATGVQMTAQLRWTPATTAVSHDIYFGTDKDAVKSATSASPEYIGNKALGAETHDPGKLAWHGDYYWRVDAVYSAGPVKGLVWNFTTADFLLVDDFESYNDVDPPDPNSNRIFDKWIDGFGTTDNGALVGNDLPPYAEQRVVHGGSQAMIYRYDNNLKTSEATMTLVNQRDWTAEGVARLSLWFRGVSANSTERMFVALNGNAVVYNDNPAVTQTTGWNEWLIDLQAFADQGVNLANVNTISIGVGTKGSPAAGGTGTMYFDDIRLVR